MLPCLKCQRQTGSAFVINLLIEADHVELLAGDPQPVDVPRDFPAELEFLQSFVSALKAVALDFPGLPDDPPPFEF